jgi:hypothetical protein
MNAKFTLIAQSENGSTTQNYITSDTPSQNFAKFDPTVSGNPIGFGAVDASTPPTYLTSRIDTSENASGSFNVGVADIVAPIRITRGTSPDGPYSELNIGVAPIDIDGVTIGTYDLDTDSTLGNDHDLIDVTEVRFGRLKMQNAYGSELLALPIPLEAQYWNGTSYIRNQVDSCTSIPASSIAMGNYKKNLTGSPTCETQLGYASGSGALTNGVSKFLRLTKPGAGNNGSVDLTLNLNTASGNTCNTASPSSATAEGISWLGANPVSRATFGIYKTPIIYLRENF